jgi:hypothetical protein
MPIERVALDPFGHDGAHTKTYRPTAAGNAVSEIHALLLQNRGSNLVADSLAPAVTQGQGRASRADRGAIAAGPRPPRRADTLTIRTNKKYFIPILSVPSDGEEDQEGESGLDADGMYACPPMVPADPPRPTASGTS